MSFDRWLQDARRNLQTQRATRESGFRQFLGPLNLLEDVQGRLLDGGVRFIDDLFLKALDCMRGPCDRAKYAGIFEEVPQPGKLSLSGGGWPTYPRAAVAVYALAGAFHRDFGELEILKNVLSGLAKPENTPSAKDGTKEALKGAAEMVLPLHDLYMDADIDLYRNLKLTEAMIDELRSDFDLGKSAVPAMSAPQPLATYTKFFKELPNITSYEAFMSAFRRIRYLPRDRGTRAEKGVQMLLVWAMAGAYHRDYGQLRHWDTVLKRLKYPEVEEYYRIRIAGLADGVLAAKVPSAREILMNDMRAKAKAQNVKRSKLVRWAWKAFFHRQERKFYDSLFWEMPQMDNVPALLAYLSGSGDFEREALIVVLGGAFNRDYGTPTVWRQTLTALESVGIEATNELLSAYEKQFATLRGAMTHLQFKDKFINSSYTANMDGLQKLSERAKKRRQPASFYQKIFKELPPSPDIPKLIDFVDGTKPEEERAGLGVALPLALAYIRDAGRIGDWRFAVWELRKIADSPAYVAEQAQFRLDEIRRAI